MKSTFSRISAIVGDRQFRRNTQLMMKYLVVLVVVVVLYSVLFHTLMWQVEGRSYSWVTSLYWTLTVMSTLGFGDITFMSDIGRVFSIVVLLSGILLLLVVLPFVFIRLAPWLEARFRMRAPDRVPAGVTGHVILCAYDAIAPGIIRRLEQENVPYYLIEPDNARASEQYVHGLAVVQGEVDRRETYEALRVSHARMVFANLSDTLNANIALTVHEVAPDVPVVTIARSEHAEKVLALSGATHVLPLKRWLGEQLANRVNASHAQLHPVGRFEDLLIAELPILHTPLVGKTIRGTQLRENVGISIIGVWERGKLYPAHPDHVLTSTTVIVVIGTESKLNDFNDLFVIYDVNTNPVLVIGAGAVGGAAILALKRKEVPVTLVESDPVICRRFEPMCEAVYVGDAADIDLLRDAGIMAAPSVLLTTNEDATNIYLTSACRSIHPELRIVSRLNQERNVEAMHRAGADFVLSYYTMGIDAAYALLQNRELIVLGEHVNLYTSPLPASLEGKTLAESAIGARTGLNVVGIRQDGRLITGPSPSESLLPSAELLMIGDVHQRRRFQEAYGFGSGD